MKAGLRKYKAMITDNELDTEQKVLAIQKEVEEATALELPMLEKNLVFLINHCLSSHFAWIAGHGNGYDTLVQ